MKSKCTGLREELKGALFGIYNGGQAPAFSTLDLSSISCVDKIIIKEEIWYI